MSASPEIGDALLILSYGGPERMDQVGPFLDRILAGRPIPEARRKSVEAKYARFNGKSPLNEETARFADRFLEKWGSNPPAVFCGNLYAEPLLGETLDQMADQGYRSIRVLIASPYKTKSSFDRYRIRLEQAAEETARRRTAAGKPVCERHFSIIPPYYQNEIFLKAAADTVLTGKAAIELEQMARPEMKPFVLFSAHALPEDEALQDGYREQLQCVCTAAAQASGLGEQSENLDAVFDTNTDFWPWNLVFQSRSGSPHQPWTGPAIGDFIRQIKEKKPEYNLIYVVPIGFFFENMETVYDLDIEAADLCRELGLEYRRAETIGTTDRGVKTAVSLLK